MNNWKRYELKERAKAVLKVNYWIAFVVALIFVIISGGLGLSNSGWKTGRISFKTPWSGRWDGWESRWENKWDNDWEDIWESSFGDDYDSFSEFINEFPKDLEEGVLGSMELWDHEFGSFFGQAFSFVIGLIIVGSIIAGLIGIAVRIFVLNPLKMGCQAFFKTSAESPHKSMNDLGLGFRNGNYGSVVKTMFFRDLFTFLWTLLFIIPGIIKAYAYRMVPYILADNPKMDAMEAIALSRKMMDGNKWNTFVLDLSFLGWYLLGTLALGIGTLFVHPYKFSTDAQLYLALRGTAPDAELNAGQQELPPAEA
jgi:uncharacterized membrane protein